MTINTINSNPIIILSDNGSTRADATVQLRVIAKKLSKKTGIKIHAVSMQHSNSIAEQDVQQKLAGVPAQIFREFMTQQLLKGHRKFILIPLFFGKSRAITSFVPNEMETLEAEFADIKLQICEEIYPLPEGDPLLIDILHQNLLATTNENSSENLKNLVLVDHGSPLPAVNAVRQHIASALTSKLPEKLTLHQAAMERRKAKEYDFNGELLEDYLTRIADAGETHASVLLLFLLPGSHAGKGGDIVQICNKVMSKYSNFTVSNSPLIGENELLVTCLENRLNKVL